MSEIEEIKQHMLQLIEQMRVNPKCKATYEEILEEEIDKALYSKYPKVAMKHSQKILETIIPLGQQMGWIENTYNEIPKLNFKVMED